MENQSFVPPSLSPAVSDSTDPGFEMIDWMTTGPRYSMLMDETRKCWCRRFSVEPFPKEDNEDYDKDDDDDDYQESVRRDIVVKVYGPCILADYNSDTYEKAMKQVGKWSRSWQHETLKEMKSNVRIPLVLIQV